MTYLSFKNNNDIDTLLAKISVLDHSIYNFTLTFDPDYDSTEYEGLSTKDYVFFDRIDFTDIYFSVIEASIVDYGFLGVEDDTFIEMFPDGDDLEKNLGDERSFKKLDLIGIDNIMKIISFYGAFRDDSSLMSGMMSINPVVKLSLLTIPKSIEDLNFYYRLLAESRLLFEEKKVKLAFFTAFSAFDMFLNDEEENRVLVKYDNNGNVVNRRLEEKLKDIYKDALKKDDLCRDRIWGELLAVFKGLEDVRNDIAHGRDTNCTTCDYQELIIVITSFVLSIKNSVDTFEDINNV